MQKIKVLLADDHKMVRNGIKSLLNQTNDIEVVAEADRGDEILDLVKESEPDVALLDISMPGMNGFDAAALLQKAYPALRILFLSMHEEPEYVIRGMKSGSSGYLLKSADKKELVSAIRKVYEGEKYFSREVANLMIEGTPTHTESDPSVGLTTREREILALVANGKVTKEIAEVLNISPRTVETHRVNIMRKLNAANTAELIKLSVMYKLVEV